MSRFTYPADIIALAAELDPIHMQKRTAERALNDRTNNLSARLRDWKDIRSGQIWKLRANGRLFHVLSIRTAEVPQKNKRTIIGPHAWVEAFECFSSGKRKASAKLELLPFEDFLTKYENTGLVAA